MNEEEPNLLSHFQESRLKLIPEGGLSTIIFCGKMRNESDFQLVLDLHRRIVEEEVNKEETNVTGLVMAQGNSILHILEGPCNSILRILSQLADSDQFEDLGTGTPPIQSGRIVYNVEDRPCRFFPEWYSCVIQERKSQFEGDVHEDTCTEVVHDLAMRLLEVGHGLQSEATGEVELNKYAEFLPGKNLIVALSNSILFFSLEEFVQVFSDPMHLELESESTWPLEKLVQY